MNPAFYQPAGPAVVRVATEPPGDYFIWSLYNWIYANPCCLGLAALVHSVKARDRKAMGDLEGAREHGSTARCLNIWATILTIILVLSVIVGTIVLATGAASVQVSEFGLYQADDDYSH